MNPSVWHLELLGGLRVVAMQGEAREITRFRTQKTAALLAYLALNRGRVHSREVLLEMLWPDEPLEASRNALRVALNSLRKQLEPPGVPHGGVLAADRLTISLSSAACTTDVSQFEQALTERREDRVGALTAALALYGGELLPGFYDDWVLREREQLSEVFVRALLELARLHLAAGEYERALEAARRASQTDSYSEEASRLRMQAHARLGNPETARQEFSRLTQVLRAELNTVPGPETRSLAAQLEQIAEAAGKQSNHPVSVSPTGALHPPAVASESEAIPAPEVTSLPFAFTRFFGRETEKRQLCELLTPSPSAIRQITLTGAGGSGKTRLAIETARLLSEEYPSGAGAVTFVSLMDEREARRILPAIAQALRLPRSVTGDYREAVVAALTAPSAALLVLDGFEQLAAEGSTVVLSLLKAVPHLRILVTSRRRLEIPGEREFSVAPLPVPGADDLSVEKLQNLPAVQLFVDRARDVRSDFALTNRNAAEVGAVVEALEGIPLALELAAARARTVSLAQMRAQLTLPNSDANRFHLLTARRAGNQGERHRSLWSAITWSFDLLPPPTRRFFTQLSVFQGGWTAEAAQAVCDEPFAGEYLTQLRAHSLVVADEAADTDSRFRLLDSLREFAAEQLTESEQEVLLRRHSDYFGRLAYRSQEGLRGGEQQEWLERLDADYGNLWAVVQRGGADALRMIGALRQYWSFRGPLRESAETAAAVLDGDGSVEDSTEETEDTENTEDNARAAALNTLGVLYLRLGEYASAAVRLEASLRLYREQEPEPENEADIARVLSNQGVVLVRQGDLQGGRKVQQESLEIRLRIGDRWGAAVSYLNLGAVMHDMGDHASAGEAYGQSLHLCREIGDTRGIGTALMNLANLAAWSGNDKLAQARYEECLTIARAQNNVSGMGLALLNLGGLLSNQPGMQDQAEANLSEAYRLYRKMGEQGMAGAALVELGRIAIAQKRYPLAHERLAESMGLPLTRVIVCNALEASAHLAFETGAGERSVRLYGAVDALRTAARIPLQMPAHDDLPKEHLSVLHTKLGSEAFETCWSQGQQMSQDQACNLARESVLLASKKKTAF